MTNVEERIMYVIQRADGKFYWKPLPGYHGYDSFEKAQLFFSEKGAKSSIRWCDDGQECKVKRVKITLID